MTISRADLNEQFAKFVTACSEFGEEWNLYTVTEHNDLKRAALQDVVEKNLDSLVLARKDFKASPDRQLITWDYHVLYSESYEVPVMYFNASYSNGHPLDLNVLNLNSAVDLNESAWCHAISQAEHPVLFRPFFMVHPCRTRDFMELHSKPNPNNYLITWISSVAALVGLKLDTRLGCISN